MPRAQRRNLRRHETEPRGSVSAHRDRYDFLPRPGRPPLTLRGCDLVKMPSNDWRAAFAGDGPDGALGAFTLRFLTFFCVGFAGGRRSRIAPQDRQDSQTPCKSA